MENVQPGYWVTYSDMANPPQTYEVLGLRKSRWGSQWELQNIDSAEVKFSDLRQAGWQPFRPYVRG